MTIRLETPKVSAHVLATLFITTLLLLAGNRLAASKTAYAQEEPMQQWADADCNLTKAIEAFTVQAELGVLEMEEYAPKLIEVANGISSSTQEYLAFLNSTAFQHDVRSLETSLSQLGRFAEYVKDNEVALSCKAVGVIAAGVVVGMLARKYIVTSNKERNIILRALRAGASLCSTCYHYCKPTRRAKGALLGEVGEAAPSYQ